MSRLHGLRCGMKIASGYLTVIYHTRDTAAHAQPERFGASEPTKLDPRDRYGRWPSHVHRRSHS